MLTPCRSARSSWQSSCGAFGRRTTETDLFRTTETDTSHLHYARFVCRGKQADGAAAVPAIVESRDDSAEVAEAEAFLDAFRKEAWVLRRETERVNSARLRLCLREILYCLPAARAGTSLRE